MKNNIFKIYGGIAVLQLSVNNGSVLAADTKAYPGSGCSLITPFRNSDYTKGGGAFVNGDKKGYSIECPIVKDAENYSVIQKAHVRVVNRHPRERISCRLVTRRTYLYPSQGKSVSVSSKLATTYPQLLEFYNPSATTGGKNNTVHSMQCYLPGTPDAHHKSSLAGYHITEN